MKKEFTSKPEKITEMCNGELAAFFVAGFCNPHSITVIFDNYIQVKRERNACLQSGQPLLAIPVNLSALLVLYRGKGIYIKH